MEKSFIEYAEEVEQEFDMGGITSGIYRKVWLEAFARWQAAQSVHRTAVQACGCPVGVVHVGDGKAPCGL